QELFHRVASEKFSSNPLNRDHTDLIEVQASLSREYQELAEQYQLLRRPFSVTVDVPYTDVWTYPPVQYYAG
nr:site-specific DNA-methyltransferase [Proteus mirabilis]